MQQNPRLGGTGSGGGFTGSKHVLSLTKGARGAPRGVQGRETGMAGCV